LKFRRGLIVFACVSVAVLAGSAPAKESAETHVDSGSFGIFMAGRRVGTETFTVTQSSSGSVIHSEFKTEGTAERAIQNSELQLSPTGEIKRYEWKEVSPGKASAVVVPNEQFLTQRSIMNPDDKPQEHPYLLPTSTTVLDDYFFIHREILAWKFLATTCKTESGQLKCPLKQRSQFGTMNPHQQSSAPVSMEFLGREKISIRGVEQDLLKVELKSESGEWDLWLNDQFKVLRILIPTDNTEVVRD